METPKKNCNNCALVKVCKYVEKMNKLHDELYGMFLYPEWNNVKEVLKENVTRCEYHEFKVYPASGG